jgi:hypothetical protein
MVELVANNNGVVYAGNRKGKGRTLVLIECTPLKIGDLSLLINAA